MKTINEVIEFGRVAHQYQLLRAQHQDVAASTVYRYIIEGDGMPFEQFCCPGHQWAYSGDDEYYGRCYCLCCGADGDA